LLVLQGGVSIQQFSVRKQQGILARLASVGQAPSHDGRPVVKCPYCGKSESKVVNSRESPDTVRRRRECIACRRRYTTFEHLETGLLIVKRDGRREEFDRRKVFEGVRKACHKRPISVEQIEDLVTRIERELRGLGLREIESQRVGEMVMDRLRMVDDIAYVRFASVYRRFQDVDSLMAEVEEFKDWKLRQQEEQAQLKLPV
jgi:transcriptional repressor NrdR